MEVKLSVNQPICSGMGLCLLRFVWNQLKEVVGPDVSPEREKLSLTGGIRREMKLRVICVKNENV